MSRRFVRPASTPVAREQQLISLAYDEAERMMREGTAPAQIVNHFLKAGSQRESWELQRMSREVELLEAKVQSLASARRVEELYADALEAMRAYSGQEVETLDDYEEAHDG